MTRSRFNSTTKFLKKETGFSNTPLNSHSQIAQSCPVSGFSVSLDWLSGTGKISKIQPLLDFLLPSGDEWAICHDAPYKMGNLAFTCSAKSASGLIVRWFTEDDGGVFYHLSLPGSFFRPLDLLSQFRYIRGLKHAYKLKCTRIDVALDDYHRFITFNKLDSAIRRGDYAGFSVADPLPGRYRRVGDEVIRESPTIYLGSQKSGKRICFYDAEFVHGLPANRWELRYRDRHATEFFNFCCADCQPFVSSDVPNRSELFGKFLSSFIAGSVAFIRRSGKNLDRAKNLPWWDKFLKLIGDSQVISLPKKVVTIDKKLQWLYRQVSKSLAILKMGWGNQGFYSYLSEIIEAASWRFTSEDMALLQHLLNTCPP